MNLVMRTENSFARPYCRACESSHSLLFIEIKRPDFPREAPLSRNAAWSVEKARAFLWTLKVSRTLNSEPSWFKNHAFHDKTLVVCNALGREFRERTFTPRGREIVEKAIPMWGMQSSGKAIALLVNTQRKILSSWISRVQLLGNHTVAMTNQNFLLYLLASEM